MTTATMAVLGAFLLEPTAELYGLEICHKIGLAPGSVQPILIRLESVEWLESHWEDLDPAEVGRPRRRYYQLTQDGAELARNALVRAEQRKSRRHPRPDPVWRTVRHDGRLGAGAHRGAVPGGG